jgi:hypothetical protein
MRSRASCMKRVDNMLAALSGQSTKQAAGAGHATVKLSQGVAGLLVGPSKHVKQHGAFALEVTGHAGPGVHTELGNGSILCQTCV